MTIPSGFDIALNPLDPSDATATRGFMVRAQGAIKQDITAASSRRSDGDTRFQFIQTESFWAQNDWSGGFGRSYPPDATAAEYLLSESRGGRRLRAPLATETSNISSLTHTHLLVAHEGLIFALTLITGTGVYQIYKYDASANTWSSLATLAAAPTDVVSYRDEFWVAYGTAADVDSFTSAGTKTDRSFKAQVLAPYGSMLFYVFYDSTTRTFRLNRYDPENTTAIADLGIMPYSSAHSVPYKMVAVGPDLYIVFLDRLFKFTSTNGNSGVLTGPVDRWVTSGSASNVAAGSAGRSAVSHEGALYYSAGTQLRRYFPGGQPKVVWPLPEHDAIYRLAERPLILNLCSVDDRLYILAHVGNTGHSSTTKNYYLFEWGGLGMQAVARFAPVATVGYTAVPGGLVALNDGKLLVALKGANSSGLSSGAWLYRVTRGSFDTTTQVIYRSSLLDFGLIDIDKALSWVGVAFTAGTGQSLTVKVYVDGVSTTLVTTGTPDASLPTMLYYEQSPNLPMVGKLFQIEITVNMNATSTVSPEIHAVTAIPNSVNPVRNGFRATFLLGQGIKKHDGALAYADQDAVDDAMEFIRDMRAAAFPYELEWLDGQVHRVRCNTLTVRRVGMRGDEESYFECDCDFQELTQ